MNQRTTQGHTNTSRTQSPSEPQRWDAIAISERSVHGGEFKTFWTRCGAAFRNKDGSINVILDTLPLSGRIQLRVPDERENG